jgi:hypothetical protein
MAIVEGAPQDGRAKTNYVERIRHLLPATSAVVHIAPRRRSFRSRDALSTPAAASG